jgi:hypothetical protein
VATGRRAGEAGMCNRSTVPFFVRLSPAAAVVVCRARRGTHVRVCCCSCCCRPDRCSCCRARPAANREQNGTAHPSVTDVHFRGARIHPDAGGHRGRVGSASSSKQEDPGRFQGSLERNHAGLQSTQDIGGVGGCSILVQQVCNPRCRQFQCRALGFFFLF